MNENVGPEQLAKIAGSKPALCDIISHSGPNGEPLACAYAPRHDGPHSWASLPTFAATTQEWRQHAVVGAILRERAYQDAKWGTLDQYPHSVGEWLLILESEIQEAKTAWCKGDGHADALEEVLQVVSVGFACLQEHGVVERPARQMAAIIARRSV